MEKDKVYLTWGIFLDLVKTLGVLIEKKIKEIEPRSAWLLLGVKRGGALIGTLLSHQLDLPIEYIELDRVRNPLYYSRPVLIIDDILDTGKTYRDLKRLIEAPEIIFCTLHNNSLKKRNFKPDIYINDVDKWVVYPYERSK